MATVILTVDEIKYIGTLLPGVKSPISPFFTNAPVITQGINTQHLVQLGVLNQSGQIAGNFNQTFQALSQARSYAGFGYAGKVLGFEAVTFFGQGRAVSLTNRKNGLEINDPAPTQTVVEELAQRVGRSAFAFIDLELEFSVVESLALVAIIDLFRRIQLAQMLEQKVNPFITIDEIINWIERGSFFAPWLMGHFQIYLKKKPDFSKEDIRNAVSSLSNKGAVSQEGNQIFCGDEIRILVARFLVIDHLIDIQAGRVLPDGTVINVNMEVVQAGLNDLLLWERVEDSVFWKLISPDQLIALVSGLLFQAEALKPFDSLAAVAPAQAASGGSHCTNCGAAILPNAKFCKGCGTPVSTQQQGNVCPQCGNAFKEGAKFCNHCGGAIGK